MKNYVKLMLDSGAYTAWRQKTPIDIAAYGRFICGHHHLIETAVNLDVIPEAPTQHKVEEAAEQGYKNLRWLRASTTVARNKEPLVQLLPVFHKGERRYWLEKMLGDGHTYIGLGGVANAGDKARRPWLDDIFCYLAKQTQQVKLHGFGITSVSMMKRYPWYSVDSVSWMKQAVMGMVYVPVTLGIDGHFCFTEPPASILMSKEGRDGPSALTTNAGVNYWAMRDALRDYCRKYFDEEQISPIKLSKKYKLRVRLNARFFKRFAHVHKPRFRLHQPEGFLHDATPLKDVFDTTSNPFKLIFSVGTYLEYANILREEGCRNQLISFHRIDTGPKFDLEEFVTTGWFSRNTRKGTIII